MNDGYDLFCLQQLANVGAPASNDDVTCICADYLLVAEGYGPSSHPLLGKRAMHVAAQFIPTTNNVNKGDTT